MSDTVLSMLPSFPKAELSDTSSSVWMMEDLVRAWAEALGLGLEWWVEQRLAALGYP